MNKRKKQHVQQDHVDREEADKPLHTKQDGKTKAYSSALLEHSARYMPAPYKVPLRLPARSNRNSSSEIPSMAAAVVPWKSHRSRASSSRVPSKPTTTSS